MPQRPAQKKKKPAVVQETRRATSVAVGEAALQAQIESGDTITDGVRLFLAMLADQQPSRGLPRTVSRQHKGFTESFWQDMRVRLAPTKKSASEWHEQNQKTLNNVFTNNGQEQLYNKRGWLFASRGKSYPDHDAEQLLATVLRRLDKLRQIKDAFSGYDGPQG